MAKRHIIPMGKHKPVRSSLGALPTVDDKRPVQPYCYRNGQAEAMLKQYNDCKVLQDKCEALAIWETLI